MVKEATKQRSKPRDESLEEYLVKDIIDEIEITDRPTLRRDKHAYLEPIAQLIEALADDKALKIRLGKLTQLNSEKLGLRYRLKQKGLRLRARDLRDGWLRVWAEKESK